jgi:protein TonB
MFINLKETILNQIKMMTSKRSGRLYSLPKTLSLPLIAVAFFIISVNANAQTGAQEEIFVVADEMPNFPGGQKALMDLIYKNITYPQDAAENGIEGKVILRFVINSEGKIVQPSISKGLYPSIDREVLKVIAKIPKFEPGKIGGKPVSVWYALPITFKMAK